MAAEKRKSALFFRRKVAKLLIRLSFLICMIIVSFRPAPAIAQQYDLLIKGGQLIDPKNHRHGVLDIAIASDTIAQIGPDIPVDSAKKVIDAHGRWVTPGWIDIHAHLFAGSGTEVFADGNYSVAPDEFTFRSGVTTIVDAGTSGWRNFEQFKKQVIDPSRTRVLAFLNIVGSGMIGAPGEQNMQDMDAWVTTGMIQKYPEYLVGVKIGHYTGADWAPFNLALGASSGANVPLFVECHLPQYPLEEQLSKMRPGDIITHVYEQVSERTAVVDEQGKLRPFVLAAQKRGVLFDLGHGGAGFWFEQAIPAMKQGLFPNTFGTDLHKFSMNSGMKDFSNVLSKFLAMGMSLEDIVERATWGAAKAIKQEDLGQLAVGATADITVFGIRKGNFGFMDARKHTLSGDKKIEVELTLRAGQVVWDLNGVTGELLTN